jgi:hypothetical protein
MIPRLRVGAYQVKVENPEKPRPKQPGLLLFQLHIEDEIMAGAQGPPILDV